MALVEGIHILTHGARAKARRIAMDIEAYQRLLIGTWSFYGAGAYAYYVDTLPPRVREEPQVLFRVDESGVSIAPRICRGRRGTPSGSVTRLPHFWLLGSWHRLARGEMQNCQGAIQRFARLSRPACPPLARSPFSVFAPLSRGIAAACCRRRPAGLPQRPDMPRRMPW